MQKLIKRFRLLFLISFIWCAVFLTLGLIPSSYDVVVPAIVDDLNNVYSFEGVDTKNVSVNSVSIYEYYNIDLLGYLEAKINKYAILEKHNNYVNTSIDYSYSSGTIQKNVSLTNGLIAGYTKAGKEINYEYKGEIIHSIYGSGEAYFNVGDIILECENEEVSPTNSVSRIIQTKYGVREHNGKYYINYELNKPYSFKILRKGEEINLEAYCFLYEFEDDSTPILGISTYSYFKINSSNPKFSINSPDSYGPSAGLMQSLFIYDALSGEGLTKGLKVVGTGTVDAAGNAGAIGGVEAKVFAAHLSKADIFFVPEENYEDALISYKKIHTNMKLVCVKNLDDCINYLKEYRGLN